MGGKRDFRGQGMTKERKSMDGRSRGTRANMVPYVSIRGFRILLGAWVMLAVVSLYGGYRVLAIADQTAIAAARAEARASASAMRAR